jgi:predicted PurR-regulated permease PerM
MIFVIVFLLICIIVLSIALYRVWNAYWDLRNLYESIEVELNNHVKSIMTLSKRDILSNDPSVRAFVKHIAAIKTLITNLTSNGLNNDNFEIEEEEEKL